MLSVDGKRPRLAPTKPLPLGSRSGPRAVTIGAVLFVLTATVGNESAAADEPNPIQRTVRYSLTIRNTTAEPVGDAEVLVFAPVKETAMQRTLGLQVSQPFELVEDDLGNQVVRLRVDLPPYGVETVAIEAKVAFAIGPKPTPLENAGQWLRPAPFVEVDHPLIQAAAKNLAGTSPEAMARSAYDWVADHVVESGYEAKDRGALAALKTGKGDCTESMYLFIALARARGIPARGVEGFVIHGDAVLRSAKYHNWAEYYAGGRWHLADPQRRVFDRSAESYLAMRIIGRQQTLMKKNRRFEASHPSLEVEMK